LKALSHEKQTIEKLLACFPKTFSEELGIDLASRSEKETFKWFLASLLFGARITSAVAARTYKEFEKRGLTTHKAVQKAGWDRLVEVLDEGGYTRYDYKTATMLLEITSKLQDGYDGKIVNLIEKAADYEELEKKLEEFKGIGPVTVNIFLRELRDTWPQADPPLQKFAIRVSHHLALIDEKEDPEKALNQLRRVWEKNRVEGKAFTHLENALLRFGKDLCTEEKCDMSVLEESAPSS
jgi:endonuclease III